MNFKRQIFSLLFLFSSLSLFAQSYNGVVERGLYSSGIKQGASYSTLFGTGERTFDYVLGFHFGGLLQWRLGKKTGLSTEALFAQQGSQINDTLNIDGFSKFSYNYLSFPLLFQYNPYQWFELQVGPQFGYLTSAKFLDINRIITDDVNRANVSAVVGIRIRPLDFPLGLDVRYIHGISDTNNTGALGVESIQQRSFQISLGYFWF